MFQSGNLLSPVNAPDLKLDASDLAWFTNELKYVSREQYKRLEQPNLARKIIPTLQDIPSWATSVEWTEWRGTGEAKFIGANADDLPRVDVGGVPHLQSIHRLGDAYGYTIWDIKNAIRTGQRLDVMRAAEARRAIETKIDRTLGRGYAPLGLYGLFNIPNVRVVTATTKTGGGTYWSATATPLEKLRDIQKLVAATIAALQQGAAPGANGMDQEQVYNRFRLVMPDANYMDLASSYMPDSTGRTLLEVVEAMPYIESVQPWFLATGAAANGTDDRMVLFPPTENVVGAVVPVEFTELAPQPRNVEYVVPCIAATGGVLAGRTLPISYMDGIDSTGLV